MSYFFDSYAIIEIINSNEKYLKFKFEIPILTSLNISEIYYYFLLNYNKQTADYWINNLKFELVNITQDVAVEAAKFRFNNKKLKLSYADCIGYVVALKNGLKFLTGDRQFRNMDNVEFID